MGKFLCSCNVEEPEIEEPDLVSRCIASGFKLLRMASNPNFRADAIECTVQFLLDSPHPRKSWGAHADEIVQQLEAAIVHEDHHAAFIAYLRKKAVKFGILDLQWRIGQMHESTRRFATEAGVDDYLAPNAEPFGSLGVRGEVTYGSVVNALRRSPPNQAQRTEVSDVLDVLREIAVACLRSMITAIYEDAEELSPMAQSEKCIESFDHSLYTMGMTIDREMRERRGL